MAKIEDNNNIETNETMSSEDVDNQESVNNDIITENVESNMAKNNADNLNHVNIDYLDPVILEVKEYTYEDLESINENSDDTDISEDQYNLEVSDVSEKQVVKGRVVAIYDKEVIVDIGFKSEGIIDKNEFEKIPEIGEEIDVFLVVFEDRKGRLILSKAKVSCQRSLS